MTKAATSPKRPRAMRRFRNILVHEYGAVDDKIVFELAGRLAKDTAAFTAEVTRALTNAGM